MKQRRAIRRIVIQASIFLLLGAIVNVAVAWGSVAKGGVGGAAPGTVVALESHPAQRSMLIRFHWLATDSMVFQSMPIRWSPDDIEMIKARAPFDPHIPSWCTIAQPSGDLEAKFIIQEASGWPCRALLATRERDTSGMGPAPVITDGWPMQSSVDPMVRTNVGPRMTVTGALCNVVVLPLVPLWDGFTINTLFFAAGLWLVFAAPSELRRWRRIKRGLCPACAYPVGASNLCTECGMPVPGRDHEASVT